MSDATPMIPISGTPIDPAANRNNAPAPAKAVRAEATPASGALSSSDLATHLKTGRSCFGGILFRRTNDFGFPEVCFAVKNADPRTARKADLRHAFFRHHCATLPFIVCSGTETVDEYTVYSYPIGEKEQPLRQLLQKDTKDIDPEVLLKKLVTLLCRSNNTLAAAEQPYRPLCCLTPDTVYLNAERKLRILPLPLFGAEHPEELPSEAGTDKADITSDLYSAAYLFVEVSSCGSDRLSEPEDPIVLRMLASIPGWRPSLSQVRSTILNTLEPESTPRRLSIKDLSRIKEKTVDVGKNLISSGAGFFKKLQQLGRDDRRGQNTATMDQGAKKASVVGGILPDDEEV